MSGKNHKTQSAARQRLVEGATELFAQRGYAGTTVREIVSAAGVTKPVLYYYFRSKEGIYLELMREAFAKLDALVASSGEEQGSAAQKLLRLCDQLYSLFLQNIQVVRIMYAIYYGPHQGAPFFDFDGYHLKVQKAICRLVEEGIRREEFCRGDAGDMTWALLGAVNVAMELHLGHPERGIGSQGVARVLEIILQGIARKKGRRK